MLIQSISMLAKTIVAITTLKCDTLEKRLISFSSSTQLCYISISGKSGEFSGAVKSFPKMH